jgi:hypothetical protein
VRHTHTQHLDTSVYAPYCDRHNVGQWLTHKGPNYALNSIMTNCKTEGLNDKGRDDAVCERSMR